MPFTRISLRAGHSRETLNAITDSLDVALTECFDVPEKDRFVMIHQHQPEELIFDRQYGGGPRSDDFILFHITTGMERPEAVKRAFYQRLVTALKDKPGIDPKDVMIVVSNSKVSDWSFSGGQPASEIRGVQ